MATYTNRQRRNNFLRQACLVFVREKLPGEYGKLRNFAELLYPNLWNPRSEGRAPRGRPRLSCANTAAK
jgi:hypothetical protein